MDGAAISALNPSVLTNLEAWIAEITLLSFACRTAQSLQRTAPLWRAKFKAAVAPRFTDGFWACPDTGGPTSAAQPLLPLTRPARSLPSLLSNRRGTDPYAGVGEVAPRGVPLSINRNRTLVPSYAEQTGELVQFGHQPPGSARFFFGEPLHGAWGPCGLVR